MGIFRDITKSLKKAAPLIGSAIGMYFGGPLGASIGSGIGSLAGGRSAEEALRNAALAGGTAYLATGPGTPGAGMKNFDTSGSPLRTMFQGADTSVSSEAIKGAGGESFLSKLIPESTMGKVALAGGIGALAGGIEDEPMMGGFQERPYPKGQMRAGMGMVDGISFNLNDDEERAEYFRRVREKQGFKDKEDEDEISTDPVRAYRGGIYDIGGVSGIGGDMLEMDRIIPDPNDTRTDVEKMSTGKLKYRTLAGKKGLTEAQLREVQEEYAKRIAPKAPMMSMASVGDPSQLMRTFMEGGEVTGPGTGTSDSVPARLSDGEFVLTAKAVRGAGGGDRDVGAARMYDMMSQLERVA